MASCSLKDMKCEACSGDVAPLGDAEIHAHMQALPLWRLQAGGKAISRTFTARNFKAAMDFLNKVGDIAEEEKHHPDLHITGYRDVRLDLSTHSVSALTINDMIMAAKIDAVPVDYSPKWLRENPAAQSTSVAVSK